MDLEDDDRVVSSPASRVKMPMRRTNRPPRARPKNRIGRISARVAEFGSRESLRVSRRPLFRLPAASTQYFRRRRLKKGIQKSSLIMFRRNRAPAPRIRSLTCSNGRMRTRSAGRRKSAASSPRAKISAAKFLISAPALRRERRFYLVASAGLLNSDFKPTPLIVAIRYVCFSPAFAEESTNFIAGSGASGVSWKDIL